MGIGSTKRPASGSATGRVWEIADELTRTTGELAKRAEVIARYASEGGNGNTASTQFHHWRDWYRTQTDAAPFPIRTADIDVGEAGRIVLPADFRRQLGIRDGDVLSAEIVDGDIVLTPLDTGIRKAQEMVRRYVPSGVSLVDELIEERRREAARDEAE
jgi:AbrB family looped-hinge helix DNA binding protein